jgi:hypothetical protein
MFMCRWPNVDLSFVSSRNKEEAIVMLDEWGDAEVTELRQVQDLMLDFSLTDDGELVFQEFAKGVLKISGTERIRFSQRPSGTRRPIEPAKSRHERRMRFVMRSRPRSSAWLARRRAKPRTLNLASRFKLDWVPRPFWSIDT